MPQLQKALREALHLDGDIGAVDIEGDIDETEVALEEATTSNHAGYGQTGANGAQPASCLHQTIAAST